MEALERASQRLLEISMPQPFLPPSLRHFEPVKRVASDAGLCVPFTYDLVHALRPRLIVDVVAGDGAGFFACCQSVRDHDIDAICYAIDDWSAYREAGAPTFDEMNDHGRTNYMGHFYVSRDLHGALDHFAPSSVDLLLIGGSRQALGEDEPALWATRASADAAIVVREIDREPGSRIWRSIRDVPGFNRLELPALGVALSRELRGSAPLLDAIRNDHEHSALRRFYAHVAEHHRYRAQTDPSLFTGKRKPGV